MPASRLFGQNLEALRFGTGIQGQGYNLFVLGPSGAGKHEIVQRFLHERSRQALTPSDWCYLHDFMQGRHPRLIELPAGKGARFRRDLEQLVEELQHAIPSTFESDEYQSRLHEIQQELGQRQSEAFREIGKEAEQDHIALIQSPHGFSFAPRNDEGEVMDVEAFQALPEERRQAIQRTIAVLQEKLQKTVQQMPRWRKEVQQRIQELNEEMAAASVGPLLEELREAYRDHPRAVEHINAIQKDVTENVNALISQEAPGNSSMASVFSRYQANLLVDNAEQQGAAVVYEDMPTYQHLVGRVEHQVHQGALLTDFRLIRAGALHRANGGYLILDAVKVLTQPFVWEGLKRALYGARVKIESLEQLYSLASTVSLEPEPMPLDLKVVLIGNRMLYYLLCAYDPDFLELFKVQADLEEDVQRDADTQRLYARLFATLAREANLKALGRDAVARLIEHASRLADDSERLSRSAARGGLLGRRGGKRSGHRRTCARSHRPADLSRRAGAREPGALDSARHHAHRHRRGGAGPGQRPVGDPARRPFLRASHPHHRHGAARARWPGGYRARGQAGRQHPLQGGDDPVAPAGLALRR
nr:ATP-binding protein [Halomonas piscis]